MNFIIFDEKYLHWRRKVAPSHEGSTSRARYYI